MDCVGTPFVALSQIPNFAGVCRQGVESPTGRVGPQVCIIAPAVGQIYRLSMQDASFAYKSSRPNTFSANARGKRLLAHFQIHSLLVNVCFHPKGLAELRTLFKSDHLKVSLGVARDYELPLRYLTSVEMGVLSDDRKLCSGDERRISEAPASPPEKRREDRLAPTTQFSSFYHDGSWAPTSWIYFSAIAVILALVCRCGISVDHLKSNTSPVITTPSPIVTSVNVCSGHGIFELEYETGIGACRCHACFTGQDCSSTENGCIVDVYQGDPTMFENFWFHNGDSCTTVILSWQQLSYYANSKQFFFVQSELDRVIRSLHDVVGNAVTEGRHIVIGGGSTQLLQAALFALSSPSRSTPTSVVSLAPYYSAYPVQTDYLRSALYRWAGDAAKFKQTSVDDAYIELVTTPNNPTGEIRRRVVNGTGGALIHDLAYYWPHYVPITAPADDELMLFSMSKSTGHAGTRIGWAIVKDLGVAQKMAKFIEVNSIGVSKDAQIRATQILRSVTKAHKGVGDDRDDRPILDEGAIVAEGLDVQVEKQALFHFGASEMAYRWRRLRSALGSSVRFSLLPEFPSAFCTFFKRTRSLTPAFAWLRCNEEDDCEKFMKLHGILTRGGVYFGDDASFVRISMVDRRSSFEILINRLEGL